MHKKSQAAMEFLMTYGWALLLVLIVIGSLTFFGILDPDRFLPEKADVGSGIQVLDTVVNENSVTLLVSNVQGKTIKDFQLNVTACNNNDGALSSPITLLPEETAEIIVSCNHDLPASSSLRSTIQASYTLATEGITLEHVSSGELQVGVASGESGFAALWAVGPSSSGYDYGDGLALDSSGNVYVTGYYGNEMDLGNGVTILDEASTGIYLAKFNSSGAALWGVNATGASSEYAYEVAIDSSDNIYIVGEEVVGLDFGGGITIPDEGGRGMFLAKYDSSGSLLWARNSTGSGNDAGEGIAVDSNANVYVVGDRGAELDFGNGVTLSDSGNTELFLAKYDSSGNILWAANVNGAGADDANAVATDNSGNVYITGTHLSGLDFGSGVTVGDENGYGMFVAKYNSSGSVLWAVNASSVGSGNDAGRGISVDSNGNVYVIGDANAGLDFGNGITLADEGGNGLFLAKFNSSGNISWITGPIGSGNDNAYGLSLDGSGHIFVTGYHGAGLDFGNDITLEAESGGDGMFVAKYDSSGNIVWVNGPTSTGYHFGGSINVDSSGNVYVTGSHELGLDFGNNITVADEGNDGMFLVKYSVD